MLLRVRVVASAKFGKHHSLVTIVFGLNTHVLIVQNDRKFVNIISELTQKYFVIDNADYSLLFSDRTGFNSQLRDQGS